MNWNQLDFFITTAHTQNITRAAEILSISQPALSRSISRLEEQLGFPLFERRGKGIVLNRCGHTFLTYAEKALKDLTQGKQAVQDILDIHQGTILLGFVHSLGISLLPSILKKFLSKFPKVEFKLYQNNASLLIKQLLAGETDLALCMEADKEHPEIVWEHLFTDDLFVALPVSHPLAKQTSLSIHDLTAQPFISFKEGVGMQLLTDQLFHKYNCQPNVVFEGDDIVTVAGLVEAGLGVSVLPKISNLTGMSIAYLPFCDAKCSRPIGLAYIKDRYLPPVARNFRSYLSSLYT